MVTRISLEGRGVIEVAGADATKFLHNLLTNNIASLSPGEARYAALLSPQGKILADFLVFAYDADGERRLLLDCPSARIAELMQRLQIYRLRSPVTFRDRSGELRSVAVLDADEEPAFPALALARDPRAPALGWRAIVAADEAAANSPDRDAYDARRIAAVVPEGGVDFAYGDTFPQDANMDLLKGIDFAKGCFVGQEVVSRMKHRGGAARKRIAPFRAHGAAPALGTPIVAGETELGVAGSHHANAGLALIRLDRLEDARAAGLRPMANGVELDLTAMG